MNKDLVLLSSDSNKDLLPTSHILESRLLLSLTSTQTNKLKQFAELGILLDEQVIFNQQPINLV